MSGILNISHKRLEKLELDPNTPLQELDLSYNWLSELPPLPPTLKKLDISNNHEIKILKIPTSLEYLNCRLLYKLRDFPQLNNLTYLDCSSIKAQIPYLPNLQILICKGMSLKTLPVLSTNLVKLDISLNYLTTIDLSFLTKLTNLKIARNRLSIIKSSTLVKLNCEYNKIQVLEIGNGLVKLNASNNILNNNTYWPTTLEYLEIIGNKLSDYGNLAELQKLTNLICTNNNFTYLPKLTGLVELACEYNKLVTIDMPNLIRLHANNNELTSLQSCSRLTQLWCCGNKMKELPLLPCVIDLAISYNLLTKISYLPVVKQLRLDNNLITELPTLSQVTYLYICNNPIKILPIIPKYVDLDTENCPLLFNGQYEWFKFNRFKYLYFKLKYGKKIENIYMKFRNKKINTELLFSPDLKNYKQFANPYTLANMNT